MLVKTTKWLLPVMVILALFATQGCKKESRDAKPPPLFATVWGADATQIREVMGAEAEIVSDNPGFLVYKKTADGYPFYITYEFETGRLIRLFLNVNIKNADQDQNAALREYLDAMVAKHLGAARYVKASNVLYANDTTVCDIQVVSGLGGLKAKLSFYDAGVPQNAPFVKNFDKQWQDGKWPKGEME